MVDFVAGVVDVGEDFGLADFEGGCGSLPGRVEQLQGVDERCYGSPRNPPCGGATRAITGSVRPVRRSENRFSGP